jgi:hypothetical protein
MSASFPDSNEYSLMVKCPKCSAEKYDACTTKTRNKELKRPHQERKQQAVTLGYQLWAWDKGVF